MKTALAAALIFAAAGCASQVPADWVAADRATKQAIAPEYEAYVDADATLTAEQKQRRHNTVATWESRLAEHEAAVKAGGQ
jgi:hypothetical protein